jgi:ABC-type transporter Mla maintaining outer membrane lipid asymmetry ATPase subunit MlaF
MNARFASTGARRRLGVARALVVEPEILFYDEPTTGLDPMSSRRVDDLIEEMRQKFLVKSIVLTHDMASAFEIAARMLLEHGRFVEEGPPEAFFDSSRPAVRLRAPLDVAEGGRGLRDDPRRERLGAGRWRQVRMLQDVVDR